MEDVASLFSSEELVADVPAVEDERVELEEPEFEVETLPRGAEDTASPQCCSSVADAEKMKTTAAGTDRVQVLQLRRRLGLLDKMHEDTDLFMLKTREELCASRQRMDLLSQRQATMAAELAAETEANNVAAMGRLQAAARRLHTELDNERDLQGRLTAALKESENAMCHIEIERGKLEDVRKCNQEEAAARERCLQAHTARLLLGEQEALGKTEKTRLLRTRRSLNLQRELGLRQQKLLEDAQRNHKVAVKFLKASLGRVRGQEQERAAESRRRLRQRVEAALALKDSITASRETMRKFQAWGRTRAQLAEQKAQAEKEAVLAQGGDAFKYHFHQRRRQELEAQRRTFEEEQKLRRQEIVSRILKEEAAEENRRKKEQPPAQTKERRTLRDRTWSYIADFCDEKTAAGTAANLLEAATHPEPSLLLKALSSESMQGVLGASSAEDETLAEPEIPGLWSKDHKTYQVPKEDAYRKPTGGTTMEKDVLARTVGRPPSGVAHKQVASGREFKGCPFNSKPKLIHFKDFDIGKVYKKKVTLINATYTISYCKLVGVEDSLKDFIHIDFDPPGPMSAGMSCEALITFKPMINKDLEGNVLFLAQMGGFSVPLKCSTKKCSLSLDKELIDFGSYVVGETTSRTITLTNAGGLGTKFRFLPDSESCGVEGSQSILKMSSFFTSEDKSIYEKPLPSISGQQLEGNESSPRDASSRRESERLDEAEGTSGTSSVTAPSENQAEITLGEVTEGDIGPFSSVRVPILFTPVIPGEVLARFKAVFKNPQCPPEWLPPIPPHNPTGFQVPCGERKVLRDTLPQEHTRRFLTTKAKATGVAVDVPVWVPKATVDLKICMYDRLYQDSVLIHTRSKAALRLKFEVCKELRGHIELLPETGYIQALSSYSVQLKFFPRHSLPEDAGKYFDEDSRFLEAPMTIRVADQMKPVKFTVQAVVTTSDLEISPSEVDFGYCTIYEAVRTPIIVSNHSLLPQEFGFVGVPKFVDIQPNDGFGTLLPLDAVQLDVLFQPTKAKEYNFELICKSDINRCFKLSCRAVGVHPPLELSHYQIKFAATALYSTSVAALYVINSHLSMKQLTQSLPRIGSEEPTPVGPMSFEFLPSPNSPITISPSVGTVWPGKRCLVRVAFRPVLPHQRILQEAIRAMNKDEGKLFRRDTPRREGRRQSFVVRTLVWDRGRRPSTAQTPETSKHGISASSKEYQAAQAILTRSFPGEFNKFVVPCVIARGEIKDRKAAEPLSFSPHNTLYLELWCPAVAPPVVVISNEGKNVLNFEDIAVGHRSIKKISIQNISTEDLTLEFSVLNPSGPFVLLNPSNRMYPGETHDLVLAFSPHESALAQETLDIITQRGTLTLTLMGTGVASMITCSVEGGVLNMGYVLAGESVSSDFTLQNESSLPIKFWVRLESLSHTRAKARQQLPQFLAAPTQRAEVVGTQNLSGQSVFSVAPVEGLMLPGMDQDFTVTFSPDHESLYYSDRLQVVLFEKKISHQILLQGAAREHMMFVEGGDPLDVPVESLAMIPATDLEHREEAEELKPILVTLDYVQFDSNTPAVPATRELHVGCVRTQLSPKKAAEFSLEGGTWLQHKGFSIEPTRGLVDRGQTKTISISWAPPADFDPDHPLMVSAQLQLRGDVKETYKVIFVAQVVTGPSPQSPSDSPSHP